MTVALTQELIEIKPETTLDVFTKPGGLDPYLKKIRVQIDAFVPIMDTKAGREEIKSFATKVAKSKTYLEGVGKILADEQKDIPKRIDTARKKMRETLDAWRDEVRQPVTDWEEAEDARIEKHSSIIAHIVAMAQHMDGRSAEELKGCLAAVETQPVGPECEEFESEYARTKAVSIAALADAIAKRDKYEAEQAELVALRKEAEVRAARDRDDAIRKEAAAQAIIQAEAKAKADRERGEHEAKAERDAAERRELALKQAAEAAEQRATDAIASAKRDQEAQAAHEKAEADRREANKQHCATVNRAAVKGLVDGGIAEDLAKIVITLVARKAIPHVTITY